MPFYALGVNLGKQIHEGGLHKLLDKEELDIVLSGFGDTVRGTSKDIKTGKHCFERNIICLLLFWISCSCYLFFCSSYICSFTNLRACDPGSSSKAIEKNNSSCQR